MCALLGALLASGPASARDYYVKRGTACRQAWPGCGVDVAGREFDDVDLCAQAVAAGDTCWIKDGTYTRGIDSENGAPYQPVRSGTSAARITFRAYPGHSPLFTGNSLWDLGVRTQAIQYITYSGLRIQGVVAIVGGSEQGRVRGITLEGCEISGGGGKDDGNWSGIFIQWAEDTTVRDSVIRDVGGAPSGHGQKGISIFNGRRTLIEHNFIARNPDEGIFDKEGGEDNVYRHNVFSDNAVHIKLNNQPDDHGLQNVRSQVYENLFIGGFEGVRMLVEPSDWKVYSNTFVNTPGVLIRSNSGPAPGGEVYDNVFYWSAPGQVHYESWNGDDREPALMDWNFFSPGGVFRENRYANGRDWTGLAAWSGAAHPGIYDRHSREGNPAFADAAAGDYHLAPGSPGLAAGRAGEDLGAYPRGRDGTLLGPRELPVVIPPPPDVPGSPSGGSGPGECANAASVHPEWIFCDDFEDSNLVARYPGDRYDNGAGDRPSGNGQPSLFWTDEQAATGSGALKVTLEPGQIEGGHLFAHFGRNPLGSEARSTTDFREIYWRARFKLQDGFVGLPSKLTRATSFVNSHWAQSMVAHIWRSSSGDRLAMDPVSGVDANSTLVTTAWNDLPNFTWLGNAPGQTPIVPGRWFCVEGHVRLDDPGLANGLFEFWVDDQLEASRAGLRFVDAYADYGINAVMLETRFGTPRAAVEQSRYIDGLVVSTARIGCGGAAEPVPSVGRLPLYLVGDPPESSSVALEIPVRPRGATHAYLQLGVFDADFPDEGRLRVNEAWEMPLFGALAVPGNDGRSVQLPPLVFDAGWLHSGTNQLVFEHNSSTGFRVDSVSLRFLPDGSSGDLDADGRADPADNCLADPNPFQRDSDSDGFGNACDADLDQSGLVDGRDLTLINSCVGFGSDPNCAPADLDEDGDVDADDIVRAQALLGRGPGPTGMPDSDGDGLNDRFDDCILRGNAARPVSSGGRTSWLQLDADGDGIGNACDSDLTGDGRTSLADYKAVLACYGKRVPSPGPAADPTCAESDLDGSGSVSVRDLTIFRSLPAPGPSAFTP